MINTESQSDKHIGHEHRSLCQCRVNAYDDYPDCVSIAVEEHDSGYSEKEYTKNNPCSGSIQS
jgi:hypothetical protein